MLCLPLFLQKRHYLKKYEIVVERYVKSYIPISSNEKKRRLAEYIFCLQKVFTK